MAAKWNGKSLYQLTQKGQRIQALDVAVAELRGIRDQVHVDYMVELGRIIERDPHNLQLGVWECDGSPTKRCIYDLSSDDGEDACLFCEQPNERK
jgi:hypothetical protein